MVFSNPVIGRNSQMVSYYCEVVVKRFFVGMLEGNHEIVGALVGDV